MRCGFVKLSATFYDSSYNQWNELFVILLDQLTKIVIYIDIMFCLVTSNYLQNQGFTS